MNQYLCKLQRSIIARVLGSAALLLLLVGCGNDASSNPPISLSPTSTPTSTAPEALFTQNPGSQITVGGMLTIAPTSEALSCRNIVFATNRLTYNSDEIHQMVNYFKQDFGSQPGPEPNTFANAQGNFVSDIPNWGMDFIPGCWGSWEITNTSQEQVQIAQVNMQLTADSQPDTYQYRFIDACSLPFSDLSTSPCSRRGGGAIHINYTINIGQARASTVFQSQSGSAELTVDPGQTVEAWINVLPTDPGRSFIYTLTPEIVLNTPAGNGQVFNLIQLTSTIALVNVNQFSCYQLHSNTFTPLAAIYTVPADPTRFCQ